MGWKIPEIKIRVPEVRVPKAPLGRAMPKSRAARKPTSGKIEGFSLTVFSNGRVSIENKYIDVIRALLVSEGNRKIAAKSLKIRPNVVSEHAKKIRRMSDADLQKYADQLNTATDEIKRVCGDFGRTKRGSRIEIIRALLASNGSRKVAAQNLRINDRVISDHAKKIRRMADAELQKYADELNTTVDEIKRVCAKLDPRKDKTVTEIIYELLEADGDRAAAARRLGINGGTVSSRAKDIMGLPEVDLQKYADELSKKLKRTITIRDIRDVAAPRKTKKINFERRVQVIYELLASDGDRRIAARNLGIIKCAVSNRAKAIRLMSDTELQIYADKLNTTVEEIRRVCADFGVTKEVTHIELIRALLVCDGHRTAAAKKLGVTPEDVGHHARNILPLPEVKLKQYAAELATTVDRIKEVCAPRAQQAKGKLFGK